MKYSVSPMPPWHVLLHAPHFGVPAVVGAIAGLFLGWPQQHFDLSGNATHAIEYQNRLGMTTYDLTSGYWGAFGLAILGLLVGAAVGAFLVSLGLVSEEDVKL